MAANPTPDDDNVLCALAEDLADGCQAHEVAIGIKQNTEAVMRGAIVAVSSAKMALGSANTTASSASALVQTRQSEGEAVARNCRLRLVNRFGSTFNASWETAGFPDQSTAVPRNGDKLFTLLGSLAAYFTSHAADESADMGATAALCSAAHTALSDARAALNAAETAASTAKKNREAAVRTLRKRVRSLIDELGVLLAEDDERYEAFGLNVPANPSAPEAIASVSLSALGGGKVLVQWTYATRMGGTRLLAKRVGVDDDFASIGTVEGLEKLLVNETPGVTLQVKAIAYNDGGDAPESPVASVVVT